MQCRVLGHDSAVLVAAVDDLCQIADDRKHVGVGNDHQLVKGREQPPVGDYLAA